MTITAPATATEGVAATIIGTGLDLVAPVQLVAVNGSGKQFVVDQVVTGPRTATDIPINVGTGITLALLDPSAAHNGVPLSDSEWSLKWVVGADEFAVSVSSPANTQLREVANAEKFGGILAGINFGTQDQLVSPIVTGTNTIKQNRNNGKAAGFFDGVEPTMSETITNHLFTGRDGRWRARDETVIPFNIGGEFTEEFTPEFT